MVPNLAHENLLNSNPVIIPYMVLDIRFITLYGIITGSLSAIYSRARPPLLSVINGVSRVIGC